MSIRDEISKMGLSEIIKIISTPELGKAATDIVNERLRQINVEGYTPEHDDQFEEGELAACAVGYILLSTDPVGAEHHWAWIKDQTIVESSLPTSKGYRDDLVKAAAMILAEIERIDRKKT